MRALSDIRYASDGVGRWRGSAESIFRFLGAGTIRFKVLPPSITKKYPGGPGRVLKRKTLDETRELCK